MNNHCQPALKPASPASPSPSPTNNHNSNLPPPFHPIHPSPNSLANLSISSPISTLSQLPSGHLQNRNIPPPLSLGSVLSKPSAQDPSNPPSDELMTARCSQFPIDSLEPNNPTRHQITPITGSCRFQPYLPPSLSNNNNNNNNNNNINNNNNNNNNINNINNSNISNSNHSNNNNSNTNGETNNWSSEPKSNNHSRALFLHTQLPPSSATFRCGFDDGSLSSSELRSSCSSLASSTASSQSSGYFPPSSGTNLPFEEQTSPETLATRACQPSETLYPPLAGPGFSQAAVYPAYTPPSQRSSLAAAAGLAYPAAAFTPSGGSPPIASASSAYFHFDSAGAGRRHTVSAYASPLPIELNLVGHPEMDESLIKEEKRRRNKESSQRFRDRTRERQREKQERLEYLERRTKQLEEQLKTTGRKDSIQEQADHHFGGGGRSGRSEERDMIERLQAENEALRNSLRTATEEIKRLEKLSGNQCPHSPLSIGQVYATTLAQLSPPASSSDFAPGSQASSPAAEPSYFGNSQTQTASPIDHPDPSHPTFSPAPPPPPTSASLAAAAVATVVPTLHSPNDPLPNIHQVNSFNNSIHHHNHPQQLNHQHLNQNLNHHSNPAEFWDHHHHHKLPPPSASSATTGAAAVPWQSSPSNNEHLHS